MTDDLLAVARELAVAALDTHRRVWMVGIAHLVDVPELRGFTDEDARAIIDIASSTAAFPSGPVGYIPGGFEVETKPDYQLITLGGPAAPHLELQLGMGLAGVVAVALTRSGVLDDGVECPGAVLLSDFESVLADTVMLGIGAALQVGCLGRIDLLFSVAYREPDDVVTLLALDEEAGRTVPLRDCAVSQIPTFVEHLVLSEESTPRSVHADLYAIAVKVAGAFGLPGPQLIGDVRAEDDEDYGPEVLRPVGPAD